MTEIRREATLRLSDLLNESISARKPLFVSPTSVEIERAKMEMEDQRSHLERSGVHTWGLGRVYKHRDLGRVYKHGGTNGDPVFLFFLRFVVSKIGKEIRKKKKGNEAAQSIEFKGPNDITQLIEDAVNVRYALLKDSVN